MQINYSSEKYTPYGGLIIIDQLCKKKGIHKLIDQHLGSRSNEAHLTAEGNIMEINHHPALNHLLLTMAVKTKLLVPHRPYCLDLDTTITINEKYDAKYAYNKELGYNPLVAAVGAIPVYIEGRSGNTSPAFGLLDAIKKIHRQFIQHGLTLAGIRIDAAGYQSDIFDYCIQNNITYYIRAKSSKALEDAIADTVEWTPVKGCIHKTETAETYLEIDGKGILHKIAVSRRKNKKMENSLLKEAAEYDYYSIVTNDEDQSNEVIYKFYNQRGAFEQNNTSLKNEFNWKHLPFSFLHQNTAFMIISAMSKILFEYLKMLTHQRIPGLIQNTGIELKSFVNKFVSVVARWVSHDRKRILKLYTNINYHLLLE